MTYKSTDSIIKKSEGWCRAWLRDEMSVNLTAIPYKYERVFKDLVMPDIIRVFPEATNLVSMFGLYDMTRQSQNNECSHSDAMCWYKILDSGQWAYAIGVSIQALAEGVPYAQMIVLHELAHILSADVSSESDYHSSTFNAILDIMIRLFNLEVGAKLTNDYDTISTPTHDATPAAHKLDYTPITAECAMAAWKEKENDSSTAARQRMIERQQANKGV